MPIFCNVLDITLFTATCMCLLKAVVGTYNRIVRFVHRSTHVWGKVDAGLSLLFLYMTWFNSFYPYKPLWLWSWIIESVFQPAYNQCNTIYRALKVVSGRSIVRIYWTTIELPMSWDAMPFMWGHCNVVMTSLTYGTLFVFFLVSKTISWRRNGLLRMKNNSLMVGLPSPWPSIYGGKQWWNAKWPDTD